MGLALEGLDRLGVDPEHPDWYRIGGEWMRGTTADVYDALRFAERSEREMRDAMAEWSAKPRQLPTDRLSLRDKRPP